MSIKARVKKRFNYSYSIYRQKYLCPGDIIELDEVTFKGLEKEGYVERVKNKSVPDNKMMKSYENKGKR